MDNNSKQHNDEVIESYNHILKDVQDVSDFIFMNHGFAPTNVELNGQDLKWKHQISLYNSLILSALQQGMTGDFSKKAILEIGCGRGGGLSFITRHYKPATAIGIDLNPNQVKFCRNTHIENELSFKEGDACALDIADQSNDVILNVESAHLYADINQFYNEVTRILKHGGYFLYTDIYSIKNPLYQRLLSKDQTLFNGLEILYAEDITSNVIDACNFDKNAFKEAFPSKEMAFLADFSEEKEALYKQGQIKYLTVIAKKR